MGDQTGHLCSHVLEHVARRAEASYSDWDIDLYSRSSHRPMVLQDQGLEVGNKLGGAHLLSSQPYTGYVGIPVESTKQALKSTC